MEDFSQLLGYSRETKVELSPSYDLLNTTIVLQAMEEIALPIRGKKNKLNRSDLFDYFGHERLGIPEAVLKEEFKTFEGALEPWKHLINQSFLSKNLRERYLEMMQNRWQRFSG